MTPTEIRDLAKVTVKDSITSFARNRLNKKPKFQVLDLIIPKERKIRSIVGGLETALGTTLWEPLAKALARKNGFQIIDENLRAPANMPSALNNVLQTVIDSRKNGDSTYDARSSHDAIKNACERFINSPIDRFVEAPKGRGVDIWLRKADVDYFFDTKTVQPNLDKFTTCMEQVLYWYAYYYSRWPNGNAFARIVFPYNPHKPRDFWQSAIGQGRPLTPQLEGLVEDDFWDLCSGHPGTFEQITNAFEDLRQSGELEATFQELLS